MWKSLDDQYDVSNDGYVMNVRTGKFLEPSEWRGYLRVQLYGKTRRIHRLVADRWLPGPTEPNLVVHHIDHNRKNNKAENLMWVTQKYNCNN
jgi:hypothetical protein